MAKKNKAFTDSLSCSHGPSLPAGVPCTSPAWLARRSVKHCSRHAQYYWYVSGPVSARPRAHVVSAYRAVSLAIVLPRSGVCTCRLRACARPMLSTASCSTHELPRFTPMMTPDLLPCQGVDCLSADCIVVLAWTCTGFQPSSRKPASLLCARPLFDCANRETATKECDKFDVKYMYPATCSCVLKLAQPELLNAHGSLELPSSLFSCLSSTLSCN